MSELTERQILFEDLRLWSLDNNSSGFQKWHHSFNPDDRKKYAREMVLYRIKKEPNYKYCLPVSLMEDLGIKINTDYIPDEKEQKLIDITGGKLIGVMYD